MLCNLQSYILEVYVYEVYVYEVDVDYVVVLLMLSRSMKLGSLASLCL